MAAQAVPTVVDDVTDTMRTNYMGIASFTILVWDHIDTLSDEVEYIWKGGKGPIVYLFLFNRYFTPLGFLVNLYAYFSPNWTFECRRFVRYEGVTVALAVESVGLMMLLRIHALYPRKIWITGILGFILLVETGMNAWLITRGEPVVHNPASGVRSCTMVFDPSISIAASSSAWLPLLYDSIILGLTLNRTIPSIRRRRYEAGYLTKRLLEDGLLYYSVIFSITLVLTIMIVVAPPGIKNITAQLEQLVTVAMMSRITLKLKKAGRGEELVATVQSIAFRRPEQSVNVDEGFDTRPPSPVIPPNSTRKTENYEMHPHPAVDHKGKHRKVLSDTRSITFQTPTQ